MIDRYLSIGLGALLACALAWCTFLHQQRDTARAERDRTAAEYSTFRAETKAAGELQRVRVAAQQQEQERVTDETRTAYGVSLDRLVTMQRAERMRRPAAGTACASGGGVPEAPSAAGGIEAAAADVGSDRPEPAAEPEATLRERCARTTLMCAYLQDWEEQTADAARD